ncbi:hypothetical protein Q672_14975 [Marinobacter sp. EVN1]|nr:hypothetical protein Q672_14975 [Marinobacter sp. EVN1]
MIAGKFIQNHIKTLSDGVFFFAANGELPFGDVLKQLTPGVSERILNYFH